MRRVTIKNDTMVKLVGETGNIIGFISVSESGNYKTFLAMAKMEISYFPVSSTEFAHVQSI